MLIDNTLFPIVGKKEKGESFVYSELSCPECEMNYFSGSKAAEIPYFRDVEEEITGVMTPSLEKVIIVAATEPLAIKVAKYICDNEEILLCRMNRTEAVVANEEDEYGIFDDDFLEMCDGGNMKLCLFNTCQASGPLKDMPGNLYLRMLADIEADGILYTGIPGSSKDKSVIEAILADTRERKYVWITPEMTDESWVTDLRIQKGFAMVNIRDVKKDYYFNLFDRMLEKTCFHLDEGLSSASIVTNLMKKRADGFAEEDMDWLLRYAVNKYRLRSGADHVLKEEDFVFGSKPERNPWEKLMQMPGLSEVKDMIEEYSALLCEGARNKELKDMHGSMIFYGNPGTGKTTCAGLLAEIMADKGVSNSSFTIATRADIIGEYVGHTSVKISKLFDKARNGVLFVDEAGFFLNTSSGGYLNEAIKEFVRFMEIYPDVTVIFAMYEREATEFLKLDEGLSSRISRMVEFADYSDKEIQNIILRIAQDNGYSMDKASVNVAMEYLRKLKEQKNFGNAREVRKLVESSIVSHSVRLSRGDVRKMDNLTQEDVKRGIERLGNTPKSKKSFGFRCTSEYGVACVS